MAIGLHFTAPAIAQTPYDGVWNVTVETRAGSCEPSVRYPVTVSDGKISAAGADITGNVGRDGRVRASIRGAFETSKRQPTTPLPPRLLAHMRRWHRLGISNHSVIEHHGRQIGRVRQGFETAVRVAGLATERQAKEGNASHPAPYRYLVVPRQRY